MFARNVARNLAHHGVLLLLDAAYVDCLWELSEVEMMPRLRGGLESLMLGPTMLKETML
jgi:hypothetical protein